MGGSGTNEELLNKIIELEQVPVEVQAVEHTNLIDGDQLCDLLKDLKLGCARRWWNRSMSRRVGLTVCDVTALPEMPWPPLQAVSTRSKIAGQ